MGYLLSGRLGVGLFQENFDLDAQRTGDFENMIERNLALADFIMVKIFNRHVRDLRQLMQGHFQSCADTMNVIADLVAIVT
jgi:hypothetical protein